MSTGPGPRGVGGSLCRWLAREQTHRKETTPSTPVLYPPSLPASVSIVLFLTAFFRNFSILIFITFMVTYDFEKHMEKAKFWPKSSRGSHSTSSSPQPQALLLTPVCSIKPTLGVLCSTLCLAPLPANKEWLLCDPPPHICFPLSWHNQCSVCLLPTRYWSFLNRGLSNIAIWPWNSNPNVRLRSWGEGTKKNWETGRTLWHPRIISLKVFCFNCLKGARPGVRIVCYVDV